MYTSTPPRLPDPPLRFFEGLAPRLHSYRVTSNFKQVGKQDNQLCPVSLVKHKPEQRSHEEIGDAEGGQAQSIEPLFSIKLFRQVVKHGGQNDAILHPSRQEEAGNSKVGGPSLAVARRTHEHS